MASRISDFPYIKGYEDALFLHIFGPDWSSQTNSLYELIASTIPPYFIAGKNEAVATIGVDIDFDLLNPNVQKFLSDYTGSEVALIDGTTQASIKGIIDAGVRDGLGVDQVAKKISDQYTMFGRVRSKLIAHNEIAQVHSQAEMLSYKESGVVDSKYWWTAHDDKVSKGCLANQAQGSIQLSKTFQSGHQAPPRHPRCRCVVIPEVA